MARPKNLRLGIIGLGNMGTSHAKQIIAGKVKNAVVTAICDIDPTRMEGYGDDIACFDDAKQLLAKADVNGILIATPHYAHTTIGILALEAGKHLLVEKPISVHKADCERLIAAHTKRGQLFAAMFNQRTDPAYKKIKQLIDEGELGELTRVNWIITEWFRAQSYYSSGGWRATWAGEGGGVLLNQCPHQLDLMQWLCGMPTKVRAFCHIGKRHDIEVEDEVTAYLEYANGATGVFITSTGEAPGTNRLEVCGTRGKIVAEGGKLTFTRTEVPVDEFCATSDKPFAAPPVWNIDIPINGKGGQHLEIMQNFTNAITKGEELLSPAREGINSVELGNAMLFSTLTDKTIEMPLDGKKYERALKKLIRESKFQKKTVKRGVSADMSDSF
jgi:predicted dehydrogenase